MASSFCCPACIGVLLTLGSAAFPDPGASESRASETSQQSTSYPEAVRKLNETEDADGLWHEFPVRENNRLTLVIDADELSEAAISTIRGAQRFLNVSALQLYNDRFGKLLAHELIARKLEMNSPDLENLLRANRWKIGHDDDEIQLHYLESKVGAPRVQHLRENRGQIGKVFRDLTKAFEVRFFVDYFMARWYGGPMRDPELTPRRLFPTLRRYGAQIVYLPSFVWNNNHMKIVSSERRALIMGGNPIDKVMMRKNSVLIWHDAGMVVEGGLLNDVNRFFFDQFNRWVPSSNTFIRILNLTPGSLFSGWVPKADVERPSEDAGGELFYFPRANDEFDGDASAQLAVTRNLSRKQSSTELQLEAAIQNASKFIFIETPFFTDPKAIDLLLDKARDWRLRELKINASEVDADRNPIPICDTSRIRSREKGILLVLSGWLDMKTNKMSSDSYVNRLLSAGIDVCKWSGEGANQSLEEKGAETPRYRSRTMLHVKVWVADGEVAYVGSANVTVKSRKIDLELGVVTTHPETVRDILRRIFESDGEASTPSRPRRINRALIPVRVLSNILFLN